METCRYMGNKARMKEMTNARIILSETLNIGKIMSPGHRFDVVLEFMIYGNDCVWRGFIWHSKGKNCFLLSIR